MYDGNDVIAKARTGTGKTLSFALPLIEILRQKPNSTRGRAPRVIIMAPTRELARQVSHLQICHAADIRVRPRVNLKPLRRSCPHSVFMEEHLTKHKVPRLSLGLLVPQAICDSHLTMQNPLCDKASMFLWGHQDASRIIWNVAHYPLPRSSMPTPFSLSLARAFL